MLLLTAMSEISVILISLYFFKLIPVAEVLFQDIFFLVNQTISLFNCYSDARYIRADSDFKCLFNNVIKMYIFYL